jgi:hypothetical protein
VAVRRLWGCLFLSAAAVAALLISDTRDSAAAGRDEATYSYGSHTRQTLDAYWNPVGEERDGRQPGLVILHGGYWHEDTGWATWSRAFADAGYAVFAVDYRLNHDAPWPAQRTDASTVLSLLRNLGGSVGVSMMQALMIFNGQTMHASLAAHVTPDDPVVRAGLGQVGAVDPTAAALALNGEITRQAEMVAFVNNYWLMIVMGLICVPLVLVLRPSKGPKASPSGAK